MRKLNRGIAVTALAIPMVLGASGLAGAAEYNEHQTSAGPDGVSASHTQAQAGDNGQTSYEQTHVTADAHGVQNSSTHAQGDGGGTQNDGILGLLGL